MINPGYSNIVNADAVFKSVKHTQKLENEVDRHLSAVPDSNIVLRRCVEKTDNVSVAD